MSPYHSSSSRAAHQATVTADLPLRILNRTRLSTLATNAEVAKTSTARQRGLLGRTGLPQGGGLWIIPCESVHTFFMKFSIDLVYIDRKNVVRKVCRNVRPWRLSACLTAHSIIELPVGAIDRSHTAPGDKLEFLPLNASEKI
jgi:uncharacterized membrane protein (UPF0127 family)